MKIEGRNAVMALLKDKNDINKIVISEGEKHGSIYSIIALAKEQKVRIQFLDKKQN